MNHQPDLFDQPSLITQQDDDLYADSRVVADGFGIEHRALRQNLLNHIGREHLKCSLAEPRFPGDGNAGKISYLLLTEDQVMFLPAICRPTERVKAFQWKLIKEFKRMRDALNQPSARTGGFNIPPTYAAALREAADQCERADAAEAKVAELAPKASDWDRYLDADGCHTMGNAAKILGTGRTRLFERLRELKVVPRDSTIPYQRYVDAGYFVVRAKTQERTDGSVSTFEAAAVTPKGLDWIRRLLEQELITA